jgi:hypothetical protein
VAAIIYFFLLERIEIKTLFYWAKLGLLYDNYNYGAPFFGVFTAGRFFFVMPRPESRVTAKY